MKNLTDTINVLNSLEGNIVLSLDSKMHHLHGNLFYVKQDNSKYQFTTESPIIIGIDNNKELMFQSEKEYIFTNKDYTLVILGKNLIRTKTIDSEDYKKKIVTWTVYAFSNKNQNDKIDKLFRRAIFPLGEKKIHLEDIQDTYHEYKINSQKSFGGRHAIQVAGSTFDLYYIKKGATNLVFIDSNVEIQENIFQKICFNILLALAFVKGSLYHKECFILGFEKADLQSHTELSYFAMDVEIETQHPTFTTNIYNIYKQEYEKLPDTEEKHNIFKDKYNKNVDLFSINVLSNLTNLLYNEEKAQRAVILYLYGHIATLEVRLPNYFVALEAITSLIVHGNIVKKLNTTKTKLNPIKDKIAAKDLIEKLKDIIKDYAKQKSFDDNEFDIGILINKINSLNSPPNAGKLSEPFSLVRYKLTDEDRTILKQRNLFLHGSFVKFIGDDDMYKEALYVSLHVQKLIAILLLKMSGFKGKIINYPRLWSSMTNRKTRKGKLLNI